MGTKSSLLAGTVTRQKRIERKRNFSFATQSRDAAPHISIAKLDTTTV
jgi:hypothetical protein